jgi:RimK family alpha-L-glutamate ligase
MALSAQAERAIVPEAALDVCVLGSASNETNVELVEGWLRLGLRAALRSPPELGALPPETAVLARLDVLPGLDGIEPGLLELLRAERRGVRVLNGVRALLAVHDKLRTAALLAGAGIPHPRSVVFHGDPTPSVLGLPLVLKPRFGSWGRDVVLCRDEGELALALENVRGRPWFRRHGALLQELVPPVGYDLRLVVAGGEVVGAGMRLAAAGEWRTNISLGGTFAPADPSPAARALAVAAAAVVGADFAGVDLSPLPDGGYAVLELNGAVEFDQRYSLDGGDVYEATSRALELPSPTRREE